MMQKVDNVPVAKAQKYVGMWVALNEKNEVIAAGKDLSDIRELVVGTKKYPPKARAGFLPEKGYMRPYKKS